LHFNSIIFLFFYSFILLFFCSFLHRLAKNTLTSALRRCALLPLEYTNTGTDDKYPRVSGGKNPSAVAVSTVSALVRGAEDGAALLKSSYRGDFVVEDYDRAGGGSTRGKGGVGWIRLLLGWVRWEWGWLGKDGGRLCAEMNLVELFRG
jgi:hypothetical protein